MPIFSRRRLRSMLNEFSPNIDEAKRRSIAKSLESKNSKTALAHEAELAFLWALTKTVKATIEPSFPETTRRPDAFVPDLFPSAPAIIEVSAISDDTFSGKEHMNRAAEKIIHFTNSVRRRSGNRLRFEFGQTSYYRNGRYHRVRLVDPNFSLTPSMKNLLRHWLAASNWPDPREIRITEGNTDVVITCHDRRVHPHNRTYCRMPALAYHLRDNPIFRALKRKAEQFARIDSRNLRCVILFDTGSYLLRHLRSFGGIREIGGEAIIWHAVQNLHIDVVCVFSPTYDRPLGILDSHLTRKLIWRITYFDARDTIPTNEYKSLERVVSQLPRPALEGYQARSLHEQGMFKPDSAFRYLPAEVNWRSNGTMTIKVSAKRLHLLLAGKITAVQFADETFRGENEFAARLTQGLAIQSVTFESGGMDKDDDYLVFELDFDFDNTRLDAP